jgi:hypothetical protein
MILPVTLLMIAGIMIYSGIHGITIADAMGLLLGRKPSHKLGSIAGAPSVSSGTSSGVPLNSAGQTLPAAGITDVSRLDQGIDFTAHTFISPVSGKVVISDQSNPGWRGGGYIAVQSDTDPGTVYYWAEGITPSKFVGDTVKPGDIVGGAAINPYNGTPGNIEFGRADPKQPSRPLAQVVSNPAGMVQGMYQWLLSLGLPKARETNNAGFA